MSRLLIIITTGLLVASTAAADPARVTANVNMRSGPGTGFNSLGKIAGGEAVDVKKCDSSGNWCIVTYSGKDGFVSGKYLSQQQTPQSSWPRTFKTDSGKTLTFYQPQVTDWKDFTELTALVATQLKQKPDEDPIFGVVGVSGRTVANDEDGEVVLNDLKVTQIDFSTMSRKALAELAIDIGKALPAGPITLSQERLTASLAEYQRLNDVSGLKSDPPPVFVSTVPAALLQTDGKLVMSPVKGVDGLSFAVNTNWDLFKTDADGKYYLRDGKGWLTATELAGDWSAVGALPDLLSRLPDDENWKDARAAIPPAAFENGKTPKVIYSDTPAELILFDGEPALEPVKGTGLKWASNTTSDVFYRDADKTWYILLSGRWFSSPSLDGPWTFATPTLPADFQNIPEDAPYYQVRASIPGTSESAEARLRASIPQMAKVSTDGSVTVEVTYSGEPKFEPIDGTSLAYAVNSNELVIRVANKYLVLKNGIWFEGKSPTGPFVVARAVPKQVYDIPPSSPVYDATYVRVYYTEPDAVWYGYTMGYLGAYLAWDTFVYGTGWRYRPYWDFACNCGYWPYYPRPVTYGVNAFYNPIYGCYGRYGYTYGPYRGIAGGAAYNPRTGTYIRGGGSYGPAGERGFVAAYNPRTGNGAVARGGQNIYSSWGTVGVKHGSDFARISGGQTAAGAGAHWQSSEGNHGFVAGGKGGDVYAGRDGKVYRRDDGQWQKHTDDGWQPVQRPGSERKDTGQRFVQSRDATERLGQTNLPRGQDMRRSEQLRPVAPDHLGMDHAGRMSGNQREMRYNSVRRLPAGGGGMGGGFQGRGVGGGGFQRR